MKKRPLLTILIPGVPSRLEKGSALVRKFMQQIETAHLQDDVEVIWFVDNYKLTIGAKRQALIKMANGEYCVFCDDDDTPADGYVVKIVEAARKGPDVVTFRSDVNWNGEKGIIEFHINAEKNEWFKGAKGVTIRKPWFVCAWKTDLVRNIPFPDLNWAEDVPWVDAAAAVGKTEVHIPEVLHIYVHFDDTSESLRRVHSGEP